MYLFSGNLFYMHVSKYLISVRIPIRKNLGFVRGKCLKEPKIKFNINLIFMFKSNSCKLFAFSYIISLEYLGDDF
ncbi:hypothetical protein UT300007_21070 [Clostridium sp. CTA-7]